MSERDEAAEIRERYLPPEQWSCPVCGKPMVFAASDPAGAKYNCSQAMADMRKPYSRERMEHARLAERWERIRPDPQVVALCDAILARPVGTELPTDQTSTESAG